MFAVTFEMMAWDDETRRIMCEGVAKLQALENMAANGEGREPRRVAARRVAAPNGGARMSVSLPRFGGPQLTQLLMILFALNILEIPRMLARDGHVPSVYDAGVRYQREPRGCEIWRSIGMLYRLGFGDCEDIATALAAWLVVIMGENALPVWRLFNTAAGRLYHILTKRASGKIEDACKPLGMGRANGTRNVVGRRRARRRGVPARQEA